MLNIFKKIALIKTLLKLKLYDIFNRDEEKPMELIWIEPFDHKLMVHYENYLNTYGEGSFEKDLNDYENETEDSQNFVMHNLVKYYGVEKLRRLIKLVNKPKGE